MGRLLVVAGNGEAALNGPGVLSAHEPEESAWLVGEGRPSGLSQGQVRIGAAGTRGFAMLSRRS